MEKLDRSFTQGEFPPWSPQFCIVVLSHQSGLIGWAKKWHSKWSHSRKTSCRSNCSISSYSTWIAVAVSQPVPSLCDCKCKWSNLCALTVTIPVLSTVFSILFQTILKYLNIHCAESESIARWLWHFPKDVEDQGGLWTHLLDGAQQGR